MSSNAWMQLALYLGVLLLLVKPLGIYMARVLQGQPCGLDRGLGWLERGIYRVAGVNPTHEQGWKSYTVSVLLFSGVGFVFLYLLQQLQGVLPFNPQGLGEVSPDLSFNTASSFVSNTNWQSYVGETTLSYLTQMLGLTVQNFVSAATGIAVLAALIRGLARRGLDTLGNFWVDLTRSTLYLLLPLAALLALLLVSQGMIQNLSAYQEVPLLQAQVDEKGEPLKNADGNPITTQTLAMGPAASQVAIKQLGTNGGGFFNVNGAHPFENPTPLSNFLMLLAILLIPAALCYTYGVMVNDTRQGWSILAAMATIFVPLTIGCIAAEEAGVPAVKAMGVETRITDAHPGPWMEGKEVRFGVATSALWATATTAASNGSVNSMHDSYTPLGGMIPMWLMQLGEVVFGGVGSGLYGMLIFVIVAVFIAGLMVGRTPEYLGKKIEAFEMKMASLVILIPCVVVLVFTAIAVVGPGLSWVDPTVTNPSEATKVNLNNPGAHGFSEILYAYTSAGNNNGSAFAGLTANEPFYNTTLGLAMLIARFFLMVPVLAIAGSMAAKRITPVWEGTLPTHTPLFVGLLAGTVLLVGALTFIPALALGPIVEHLQMIR